MLTLIATLALAVPLPQDPAAEEPEGPQRPEGVAWIGSPAEKWQARKFLIKDLGESGGQTLIERYRRGAGWCVSHVTEEAGVASEDGRDTGITALVALTMLGESSAVTGGSFRFPLRWAYINLRDRQNAESGAFLEPGSKNYALDQALATHAMCEITFSDGKKKQVASAKLGLGALLDARGEDGLWRAAGGNEGPPDPLTTAFATHALFAGLEAKLKLPSEPFEKILAWTAEAPMGEGGIDTMSILAARLFASAATETGLKDDARVDALKRLVADRIPAMEDGVEMPDLLADPVHAYLASLTLVQVDGAAYQRLSNWYLGPFLVEHQPYEGDNAGSFPEVDNGPFPKGQVATSSLRVLTIQNQRRELPLTILDK